MKTETKFGLLTILILVGVFGYVVYEKWEERKAIIAAGGDPDAIEEETSTETNPEDPFKGESSSPVVNVNNVVDSSNNTANPFSEAETTPNNGAAAFASNTQLFNSETEPNFSSESSNEPAFANEPGNQFAESNPFSEPEPNGTEQPLNQNEFAQQKDLSEENLFGSGLNEEPPVEGGFSSNFEPFAEAGQEPVVNTGTVANNEPASNNGFAQDPFPSEDPAEDVFTETPNEELNAFNDVPAEFSNPSVENNANVADAFGGDASPFEQEEPAVEDAFAGNESSEPEIEEPAFNLEENGLFEETSAPSEFAQNQSGQGAMEESPFAEQEQTDLQNDSAGNEPAFNLEEPGQLDIVGMDSSPFNEPEQNQEPEQNGLVDLQTKPKPAGLDPFTQQSSNEYQVQNGDNLWKIASNLYGSGSYASALAQYNQQVLPDPSKLKPGMILKTPALSLLKQYQPSSSQNIALLEGDTNTNDPFAQKPGFFVNEETGEPFYKVQSNDTLTEIAHRHLGRASRWIQIVALNKNEIKDPKSLKPGTILRLPADARTVVLTSDSFQSDRN
ncbi:MAG: LysM peptidoglycan-binding domain-containing protein [Planctomycetaceae bacterium]|nr:LysM peptidoglycan-binding domain-containing protein [Planctomycetaceae bacterium]